MIISIPQFYDHQNMEILIPYDDFDGPYENFFQIQLI